MLEESLALLLGTPRAQRLFVDATFGAGGHTKEILARAPGSRVIAVDADPAAVERARELASRYPGRLIAVHANFADLDAIFAQAGESEVDGVLYDLGLSSLQLADAARGFSFAGVEPLDMRLDPNSGEPSAQTLLAELSEGELARIIHAYGDERHARRIARSIVTRRKRSPLRTTSDLVAAVLSAQPARSRRSGIHPATRTFQALRIAVNHDVERLERSLESASGRVRGGGRVVVISFHSGEDGVVKRVFRRWVDQGRARSFTRKPLTPSQAERAQNPRSRSAKLRAVEIIGAPSNGGGD